MFDSSFSEKCGWAPEPIQKVHNDALVLWSTNTASSWTGHTLYLRALMVTLAANRLLVFIELSFIPSQMEPRVVSPPHKLGGRHCFCLTVSTHLLRGWPALVTHVLLLPLFVPWMLACFNHRIIESLELPWNEQGGIQSLQPTSQGPEVSFDSPQVGAVRDIGLSAISG